MRRRGHCVTLMDPYLLVGKKLAKQIGGSYTRLVQSSPQLFGTIYSLGESYRQLPYHSPVYWANGKMAKKMEEYLSAHSFDAVVMSHMYPAHILANLKSRHIPVPKSILIATDYTCIPFMEETDCDYYVIPSPELTGEFSSYGIPLEKMLSWGIPVREEFCCRRSKAEARSLLGLSPDCGYILLSGGSIGAGKIEETIDTLKDFLSRNSRCRLVVISGNNQKLYRRLQKKYRKVSGIRILASTSHMADYMAACDVFITKPGGLSSTEAAVAGIPLIHISPIPGCETRNMEFFSRREMSLAVNDPRKELLPALQALTRPDLAFEMRQAQSSFISASSTTKLCDFIEHWAGKQ